MFFIGSNDWSWRVRYAAISGLVKICHCNGNDVIKEGIRTTAWNSVIRVHSLERDSRVLEALKVGQVDAAVHKLLTEHMGALPTSVGGKIALGLSRLYLPPIRPPVDTTVPPRKKKVKEVQLNKPFSRKPQRTSLRYVYIMTS